MNETAPPPEIPWDREIRRSLEGAFRLFLFDAAAMRYFSMSIAGFWRSFFAAVIAAPIFVLILFLQDKLVRAEAKPDMPIPPLADKIGAELIAYPLSVTLFPIAMIGLARLLKVTDRYVPYIIAYNWSAVVTGLIGLFPLLLFAVGLLDAHNALAGLMGMNLVILVYLWFVARTGLGVPGITAVGLVAIDVLLSILLGGLIDLAAG